MSRSHLGEQLQAYADGQLTPEEARRVEAHLAQCPHCVAELEELRALGDGLNQTLGTVFSPVKLSREADDRIRSVLLQRLERRERAGWLWQLWGQRMRVAQAALAMLLLVFSFSTYRVLSLPAPMPAQEVLVFGESRLAPGSRGALRVVVRTVGRPDSEMSGVSATGGKPALGVPMRAELGGVASTGVASTGVASTGVASTDVASTDAASTDAASTDAASAGSALASAGSPVAGARIVISILTESGVPAPLYDGETDDLGTLNAAFTVPELPEGKAELVVETTSAAGEERLQRTVTIARSYKIYVMADKPAYRPGQTVWVRALVLDATTLRPVSGQALRWHVALAGGETLCRDAEPLSAYGVSTWQCHLPDDITVGDATLRATLGDTTTERVVAVEDYKLPAFKIGVTTDRSYYAPGDTLVATVDAEYFFGMPVGDAEAILRVHEQMPDGRLVSESRAVTDPEGHAEFALVLPGDLADGQLMLEAQVVDAAGQVAGIRQAVPVNRAPLLVRALPESGVLKAGVPNDIFLMVTTPDGRPAATDLDVTADGERYELVTDALGLAVLRLTPSGDTELRIRARDALGVEVESVVRLPADEPAQALLLHTPKAIYEAGETLHVEALVAGDTADPVYLDIVQDGRMVATLSAPVEAGAAMFAQDLDPEFVGALELRAYTVPAEGTRLQDTRLIVVDPPRALAVTIDADQDRYMPGDVAHLEIQTTAAEPAGAGPAPAVLGISIVDASVYALDTLPAAFARAYALANDEMLARRDQVAGLDLSSTLDGLDDIQASQDLSAQAAWAGAPVAEASLRAQASLAAVDSAAAARQRLAGWLYGVLVVIPVVVAITVVQTLRRTGLLSAALKRGVIALAVLVLLAPLLIAGLVVGWLIPSLGAVLFFVALLVGMVLLGILFVYGWRRKRAHVQLFTALLLTYLVLAGITLVLAGRGAEPGGMLILLVATFLLLILTTLLEGQALLLERALGVGWSTTALALVLAILAVSAPAVPALESDLAQVVGSPLLYVGPLGWFSGCAGAAPMEAPATAEAETAEEPAAEQPEEVAPTAMPVATPSPVATAPVVPVLPAEPYPLRQVFPETLYWDPAAETDIQGRLSLDVPLADSLTTWQVTALASTLDGAIGAAEIPLVVSQDLILEVAVPGEIIAGEALTLTLSVINTADLQETVSWHLPDEDGFVTLMAPSPLTIPATSGAGTTWVIRPRRAGPLALDVTAAGERSGDRVLVALDVVDRP